MKALFNWFGSGGGGDFDLRDTRVASLRNLEFNQLSQHGKRSQFTAFACDSTNGVCATGTLDGNVYLFGRPGARVELKRAPSTRKSDSIVALRFLSHTAHLPRQPQSSAESTGNADGKVTDGNFLLSVSFNDVLEVFDLDTGKLRCSAEVEDRICSIAVSSASNGRFVFFGTEEGNVGIFDTGKGRLSAYSISRKLVERGSLRRMIASGDVDGLTAAVLRRETQSSAEDGDGDDEDEEQEFEVSALAVSPDGSVLLIAYTHDILLAYHLPTQKVKRFYRLRESGLDGVSRLLWVPPECADGCEKYFLSAHQDGEIVLWKWKDPDFVKRIFSPMSGVSRHPILRMRLVSEMSHTAASRTSKEKSPKNKSKSTNAVRLYVLGGHPSGTGFDQKSSDASPAPESAPDGMVFSGADGILSIPTFTDPAAVSGAGARRKSSLSGRKKSKQIVEPVTYFRLSSSSRSDSSRRHFCKDINLIFSPRAASTSELEPSTSKSKAKCRKSDDLVPGAASHDESTSSRRGCLDHVRMAALYPDSISIHDDLSNLAGSSALVTPDLDSTITCSTLVSDLPATERIRVSLSNSPSQTPNTAVRVSGAGGASATPNLGHPTPNPDAGPSTWQHFVSGESHPSVAPLIDFLAANRPRESPSSRLVASDWPLSAGVPGAERAKSLLVTGHSNNEVKFWDFSAGNSAVECLAVLDVTRDMPAHVKSKGAISSVAFDAATCQLALGFSDGEVALYRLDRSQNCFQFCWRVGVHFGEITLLTIDGALARLAACDTEGTYSLLNTHTGQFYAFGDVRKPSPLSTGAAAVDKSAQNGANVTSLHFSATGHRERPDEHVMMVGTSHGGVLAHSSIDGSVLECPLLASTFNRKKIVMIDTVDEFGRPISDFAKFTVPDELKQLLTAHTKPTTSSTTPMNASLASGSAQSAPQPQSASKAPRGTSPQVNAVSASNPQENAVPSSKTPQVNAVPKSKSSQENAVPASDSGGSTPPLARQEQAPLDSTVEANDLPKKEKSSSKKKMKTLKKKLKGKKEAPKTEPTKKKKKKKKKPKEVVIQTDQSLSKEGERLEKAEGASDVTLAAGDIEGQSSLEGQNSAAVPDAVAVQVKQSPASAPPVMKRPEADGPSGGTLDGPQDGGGSTLAPTPPPSGEGNVSREGALPHGAAAGVGGGGGGGSSVPGEKKGGGSSPVARAPPSPKRNVSCFVPGSSTRSLSRVLCATRDQVLADSETDNVAPPGTARNSDASSPTGLSPTSDTGASVDDQTPSTVFRLKPPMMRFLVICTTDELFLIALPPHRDAFKIAARKPWKNSIRSASVVSLADLCTSRSSRNDAEHDEKTAALQSLNTPGGVSSFPQSAPPLPPRTHFGVSAVSESGTLALFTLLQFTEVFDLVLPNHKGFERIDITRDGFMAVHARRLGAARCALFRRHGEGLPDLAAGLFRDISARHIIRMKQHEEASRAAAKTRKPRSGGLFSMFTSDKAKNEVDYGDLFGAAQERQAAQQKERDARVAAYKARHGIGPSANDGQVDAARAGVSDTKDVMNQNLLQVSKNIDKASQIEDKSAIMRENARNFHSNARKLAERMEKQSKWWHF